MVGLYQGHKRSHRHGVHSVMKHIGGDRHGESHYPAHNVKAHGKHPHVIGSGSKGDGAYGHIKDHHAQVMARGKGQKYVIEDGSRTHNKTHWDPDKHHSKPGHTEQYPFRKSYDGLNHDVPHAFRAHHHPESGRPRQGHTSHGPMAENHGAREKRPSGSKSSYSPLRFSGHPGAHQVGKLSKGRKHFQDRQTHVWGKTSATKQTTPHKGEKTVARGKGDTNQPNKYSLYT